MPPRQLRLYQWVIIIALLLMAFFLRIHEPGAAPLQGDEVWNAFLAFQFGTLGERQPLGVVSSTGLNQAPFFADVFALPFLINPDPRIARLFMALLQTIGLALLFQVGRRCWSAGAGAAALAIMATMPRAVWAGRFLWNPYLAVPLVAAYLLTGQALSDGRKWGAVFHLPVLALVVQAHPSGLAFLPLTALFYGHMLWKHHHNVHWSRHLTSIGLTALSGLPWIIGILASPARDNLSLADLSWDSATPLGPLLTYLQRLTTQLDVGAFGLPPEDYTPPAGFSSIEQILGYGLMFAAAALIVRGLYRRRFADVAAGACFWLFPLTLSILPSNTYDFYLVLLLPCAALVWSLLLIGAYERHRTLSLAGWGLTAFIVLVQLYISIDGISQLVTFNHFTRDSMLPLDDMIALHDAASASETETLFVVEGASPDDFEQALLWQILAGRDRQRVIWGDTRTLPIPPKGANYVDYEGASVLPEILGSRAEYNTVQDVYRLTRLPAESTLTPTCYSREPSRFAIGNGARVVGYTAPDTPEPVPGSAWRIFMLWEGKQHPDGTTYQMAVHLINDAGDKYTQVDVPTLPPFLWREDEQLVTPLTLAIPDALPADVPLSLRIIFYTLPDMASANAIDTEGNMIAPWVILPLCPANLP